VEDATTLSWSSAAVSEWVISTHLYRNGVIEDHWPSRRQLNCFLVLLLTNKHTQRNTRNWKRYLTYLLTYWLIGRTFSAELWSLRHTDLGLCVNWSGAFQQETNHGDLSEVTGRVQRREAGLISTDTL